MFPESRRLNDAMADFYESVVNLYHSIVVYLRRRPIWNILAGLLSRKPRNITDSMKTVERHRKFVDRESVASKMELDETRHQQIHTLLTNSEPTPSHPTPGMPWHYIPVLPNTGFYGREEELEICRSALSPSLSPNSGSPRCFALSGMGGVSRTSIARKFVEDQKGEWKVILWLASDSEIRLLQSYSDAAKYLGLPGSTPADQRDGVKAFLNRTDEPWLVIFDNVESGDDLEDSLPTGKNGAILFTSRNPETHHGMRIPGLVIRTFDSTQARDFLLHSLPEAARSHDKHKAEALSKRLGGLALGIKQIAAYLRESGVSIAELLQILEDKDSERQIFEDRSGFAQLGYGHTLSTAWEISLSRLGKQSRALLNIASLLDPEGIEISFLKKLWATLEARQHALATSGTPPAKLPETVTSFFSALGNLTRYGLLEQRYEARSVGTHRLIQATPLHTMDPDQQKVLTNLIIETIFDDFPHAEITGQSLFSYWPQCSRYTPHILYLQQVIQRYEISHDSDEKLWSLVFNCARYLIETGRMLQGEEMAKAAEYLCDTDSTDGLIKLSFLQSIYGVVATQHRQHAAAADWFEKVYETRRKYLGETNEWTLSMKLNLGLAMVNARRFLDVVTFYGDAPENEAWAGARTIVKMGVHDQLAVANCELGNLDVAWAQAERLLDLLDQMSDHDRAGVMYTAGKIRTAQGLLEEALQCFTESVGDRKKNQGDHIQTAAATYRMGDVLARLGRLDEAMAMLEESRRIWGVLKLGEQIFRAGKARSEWRLAIVMREVGRGEEAETLSRQALVELGALSGVGEKDDVTERDFNLLLNQMDS